jgi:hypothetical protein
LESQLLKRRMFRDTKLKGGGYLYKLIDCIEGHHDICEDEQFP